MAVLEDVKNALGVVGDHADAALDVHIKTVEGYLRDAGVSEAAIADGTATGAIVRGVADLWNTASGGVGFSPVFTDMAIQLAVCHPAGEEAGGDGAEVS